MTRYVIEGFEKMTSQEIFDAAVKHIGSTGVQSYTDGKCVYGGTGCNASPFLNDAGKELGDLSPHSWADMYALDLVPPHNSDLIQSLQEAHDSSDYSAGNKFKSDYDEEMRCVANQYNLNTDELDKLGWDKLI